MSGKASVQCLELLPDSTRILGITSLLFKSVIWNLYPSEEDPDKASPPGRSKILLI